MSDSDQNFHKVFGQVIGEIKLKSYQLHVCETIIAFLSTHLKFNNIPMSSTDKSIMEMYVKVLSSTNIEQAEAHFIGLADKFCQDLGLGDFESVKNKFHSTGEF